MELLPGIEVIGLGLWLKNQKVLILSDLHLGYEQNLHQKGILLPKFQLEEILNSLQQIFQKVKPQTIVINGDFKHEFASVSKQEWNDALKVIDYLQKQTKKIILIRGNHDTIIEPIALRKNIRIMQEYKLEDISILHGDKIIDTDAKTIIIGHEHPAVSLTDKSKTEKYKCFLKGKWNKQNLIVMPSFNPLLEGTNVLKQTTLSPYLKEIENFEVYVVGEDEVFNLGKIKKLREINN
jgi:putative SbcD/Mre11-related phosphoesterase